MAGKYLASAVLTPVKGGFSWRVTWMPVSGQTEDGWIAVEVRGVVYEGVLEIKSTRSDQFG